MILKIAREGANGLCEKRQNLCEKLKMSDSRLIFLN